jgi:ubiquinone/menaquinone biosynthesis C-methylase UbiE
MNEQDKNTIQVAYDAAAHEYAKQLFHELDGKPLDRKLLDLFAERVIPLGKTCEIGCGPGEVAHYLKGRGVDVVGIDLSPNMIEEARKLSPHIKFAWGDVFDLQFEDHSFGGVVAFYLIVNFQQEGVPKALAEIFRVLIPGGILLLSFHLGQETIHFEEFFEQKVPIDFILFSQDEIVDMLKNSGFEINEAVTRTPYKDAEYQTNRAYIFAQKPK